MFYGRSCTRIFSNVNVGGKIKMTLTDKDLKDLETILGHTAVIEIYKFSKEYVYENTKFCSATGKYVFVGKDKYYNMYKSLEHYLKSYKK